MNDQINQSGGPNFNDTNIGQIGQVIGAYNVTLNIYTSPHQPAPAAAATPVHHMLWIHADIKQKFGEIQPQHKLNWLPFCEREHSRRPTQEQWEQKMRPKLVAVRNRINATSTHHIDLRCRLPLSLGVAVGATLPYKAGYIIRFEQSTPGHGASLWSSSASTSSVQLQSHQITQTEGRAEDVIVALSTITDIQLDLVEFVQQLARPVHVIYARAKRGEDILDREHPLQEGDAVAVALAMSELLSRVRREHRNATLHLLLNTPLAVALFLGQFLNGLGIVQTYDFERGKYIPSIRIDIP